MVSCFKTLFGNSLLLCRVSCTILQCKFLTQVPDLPMNSSDRGLIYTMQPRVSSFVWLQNTLWYPSNLKTFFTRIQQQMQIFKHTTLPQRVPRTHASRSPIPIKLGSLIKQIRHSLRQLVQNSQCPKTTHVRPFICENRSRGLLYNFFLTCHVIQNSIIK